MDIINLYNKPIPKEDEIAFFITAVLTRDTHKMYAVYLGVGSKEFIRDYGVKCSYKEALIYFPDLLEREYRR